MNFVQITTIDADFVEIVYNYAAQRWERLRVNRKSARVVAKLAGDEGVEVIFNDGNNIQLKSAYVDDVDGQNPQTEDELYIMIKALMK